MNFSTELTVMNSFVEYISRNSPIEFQNLRSVF